MAKLFLVLVFIVGCLISEGNCCAPYFGSPTWQKKKSDFTPEAASSSCTASFKQQTNNGHAIITGAAYCTIPGIMAGRWFCVKSCETDCKSATAGNLETVDCHPPRIVPGDVGDPSKLFIQCVCQYKGIKECNTKETSWADVESQFSSQCSSAGAASSTTTNGGAVTTTNGGAVTTTNGGAVTTTNGGAATTTNGGAATTTTGGTATTTSGSTATTTSGSTATTTSGLTTTTTI